MTPKTLLKMLSKLYRGESDVTPEVFRSLLQRYSPPYESAEDWRFFKTLSGFTGVTHLGNVEIVINLQKVLDAHLYVVLNQLVINEFVLFRILEVPPDIRKYLGLLRPTCDRVEPAIQSVLPWIYTELTRNNSPLRDLLLRYPYALLRPYAHLASSEIDYSEIYNDRRVGSSFFYDWSSSQYAEIEEY